MMATLHNDGTVTANDGTFLGKKASWLVCGARGDAGLFEGNYGFQSEAFPTKKQLRAWFDHVHFNATVANA